MNFGDALRDVAHWVHDVSDEGAVCLPDRIVNRSLNILLDNVSVAVAGMEVSEVGAVCRLAASRQAEPGARLLGGPPGHLSPEWAALANATAMAWSELDEGYRPAACHGGLYTVPATLAELEAVGGTVGQAIVAIVTGYEVAARLARAQAANMEVRDHPHAVFAAVGAATAVASIRNLAPEDILAAIQSAATMAMRGPFGHAPSGALIRNVWAGVGAWCGFLSVDLALIGVAGNTHSAPEALLGRSSGECELDITDLGIRFAVEDGYHKRHACCQYTHAAAEAAIALHKSVMHLRHVRDITAVDVETHSLAADLNIVHPSNMLAAKFSLPHVVATGLLVGSVGPASFTSEAIGRADIARLRERIRISPWPTPVTPPHDRPARVSVRFADGRVHEKEVLSAAGGADRPLTHQQLLEKFGELAGHQRPYYSEVAARILDHGVDFDTPITALLDELLRTRIN